MKLEGERDYGELGSDVVAHLKRTSPTLHIIDVAQLLD